MREPFYRDFAEGSGGARYAGSGSFENAADLEDVIQDLFGGRAVDEPARMRGGDVGYRLEVKPRGGRGAKIPITLADGSSVEVTIPRGVEAGQVLRLKGKGSPGIGGGPSGDALIEVQVRPHPCSSARATTCTWRCRSRSWRPCGGGKVTVPTLHGSVVMTIPRRSTTGGMLRLKGKGAECGGAGSGDQYVRFEDAMPLAADEKLEEAVADWSGSMPTIRGET